MDKPKPTKSPMALILEAIENQTKVTEALRLEVQVHILWQLLSLIGLWFWNQNIMDDIVINSQ